MQTFVFPDSEAIHFRAWQSPKSPRKVLFIRFHAFGDLLAALPAADHFQWLNPATEIHFLTCEMYAEVPRNMTAFSKIWALKTARGGWKMRFDLFQILPFLWKERFDAVIDLQNNRLSKSLRKVLFPSAWSQFDRFSKIHAVHRYQKTVDALGCGETKILQKIRLKNEKVGLEKLIEKGWNAGETMIFLNPCGLFETRRWGIKNYIAFAKMWLEKVDPATRFVLLGLPSLAESAQQIEAEIGKSCINLLEKTTVSEAINIIRKCSLTLSDDGALLHASWLNHVPTISFLGASPSFWGRPLGEKAHSFDSSDLPCGNCHSSVCRLGDVRCLTRVTVEMAFNVALKLDILK